ncbi:MAG: serine acetyltransferase [Clostridia bacterium]|nr:serine acetyltransferase [Clostridia bacterium]
MRKLAGKIKFFLIEAGIPWKDERFMKDLKRWKSVLKIEGNDKHALAELLAADKAFRSLYQYRIKNRFYRGWVRMLYPPMDSLYITTANIGGGLFIQHGFSTYIAAESIGENCWINQQVTIGYRDDSRGPIIGDDVTITCGAKVLGPITIGDRVTIGANAVVIKDCPPDSVWGGVPAKRIR